MTSSNCIAGAAATGSGIGPRMLDYVLGIVKAYTTRVGTGPFPTELTDDDRRDARRARQGVRLGHRPARRCGWIDMPALRRSFQLNGVDGQCITKLDVLDGMPEIRLCTHYIARRRRDRPDPDGRRRRRTLRAGLRNDAGLEREHRRRADVRRAAAGGAGVPASASRR